MTRLRNRANAFLSISAGFLSMPQADDAECGSKHATADVAGTYGGRESQRFGRERRFRFLKCSHEVFASARSRGFHRTRGHRGHRGHRGRTGVGILERRARPPRRRERFGAASSRRLVISTVNVHA
jgi:hypothetical protein